MLQLRMYGIAFLPQRLEIKAKIWSGYTNCDTRQPFSLNVCFNVWRKSNLECYEFEYLDIFLYL